MPAKHRVHGRGGHPERPADHVRSFSQLCPSTQDRLLDDAGVRLGERCGRLERSRRRSPRRRRLTHFDAVCREQPTATAAAVIVTPAVDQIADALTLTDGQHRICMKIDKSPPLGRDSLTSRTLGGLAATSDRQQRVWELHLAGRRFGNGSRLDVDLLTGAEIELLMRRCSRRAATGVRNRALIAVLRRCGLRLVTGPRGLDG